MSKVPPKQNAVVDAGPQRRLVKAKADRIVSASAVYSELKAVDLPSLLGMLKSDFQRRLSTDGDLALPPLPRKDAPSHTFLTHREEVATLVMQSVARSLKLDC